MIDLIGKNGFVFAFLLVGLIMAFSFWLSSKVFQKRIPGVAIAIILGLGLATFGGKKGISDIPIFAGMAFLGGSMLRDFTVVATATGVDIGKIKDTGLASILALLVGVTFSFFAGVLIAYILGYRDVASLTTIGAGACTYIVGPVTGTAVGASSDIIAISVAIGLVKTLVATIGTPIFAKKIGLINPEAALVFGGLIGTSSGVTAGLAATDPKLVPYGALTATFYTGLGCLLCPSIFYLLLTLVF